MSYKLLSTDYIWEMIILFIFVLVLGLYFLSGQIKNFPSLFSKKLSYVGLHVEKNHFVDEKGKIVVLRGASRWSLEFSCGDDHFMPSDFSSMKSWRMNIVRIPFNENYFLNPDLCRPNYQATFFKAVDAAKQEGLYVILDLHWIYPKEVINRDDRGGQFPMPDEKSLDVWKILAEKYKNDPQVLFEFMNEPHDISCSVWRNGGEVSTSGDSGWIEEGKGKYKAVGFQKFVDLVRGLGADNMIIQGSGGEANLSCALEKPLSDPRNNIAYSSHFYTTNPNAKWKTQFKNVTDNFPVIAGEFDSGQAMNVLPLFENDLQTGYMFWAWQTRGDVIADFSGRPVNDTWEKIREFMTSANSSYK